MLFNSWHFAFFFPIVVALYFAIPHRYRWMLLLGASYYFYMSWKVEYIILIIISTLIDYYAGIQMGKTQQKSKRKKYLILSFCSNIGILFAFKYFNFFNQSIANLANVVDLPYHIRLIDVILPVGISFYTFQTLSYSVDVYRGVKEPETHLGIFALYVSFFPQLVAGPIERSTTLLPQFREKYEFDYQRVTDGLKLMSWGLFKKVLIADRLAIVVDQVYSQPENYVGVSLLVGTVLFAYQIYCDFSGYSDIAIGAAQVMGFKLMDNFKQPYYSKSIPEFWRRWHISLSTWFRDYLYIPLGGNRVVKSRWLLNLFLVFLISGLWHGANWTFVLWGALHGIYFILYHLTKKIRSQIWKYTGLSNHHKTSNIIQLISTFSLVCLAWIFFRANNVNDAFYIITHLHSGWATTFFNLNQETINAITLGMPIADIIILLCAITTLEIGHIIQYNTGSARRFLSEQHVALRWSVYYLLVLSIIVFGKFSESAFIYFQF